jgi:hypothetical protein
MNPYAPPDEPDGDEPKKKKKKRKRGRYSARFDGNVFVVSRDAELPAVCLKCGKHDDIVLRPTNFQWTPLWSRLLLPFCAIGGLLAMSLTRKHASLKVPLCAPCNKQWTNARNALIAGIVALVLSVVFMRTRDDPKSALVIPGLAIVAFLGLVTAFIRPRVLRVDRITDAEVHLKGFHTEAAQEVIDGAR